MGDAAVDKRGGWAEGPGGRVLPVVTVALAVIAQLIVLVPFTVASGLVAPLWAIVLLYLVWAGAAFLLVRVARRRPLMAPLVPAANALVLWAVISIGQAWLGWTP